MSHVVTRKNDLSNREAMYRTCKRQGWKFDHTRKTYRWNDSWVDDSPIPQHLFSPEETKRIEALSKSERKELMNSILGKCEGAITIPGCNFEIGLVRNWEGKLIAIWDWVSYGGLKAVLGSPEEPEKNPLYQMYGVELTKLQYEQAGCEWTETWNPESNVYVVEGKENPLATMKGSY